uniref:Major facilitator superfamily (MFS) profile domain-containing protein n=1 Tax=Chromulina nebulosa TaxID=96789 RepID=A0A7S0ST91_9STRA|mmetsp:Transcript_2289/g.2050  ORF Transcript_2289/g.2050 Transcript_2289/m.2050 type:complete len:515 (+) Transcript_2289:50-1594(+)
MPIDSIPMFGNYEKSELNSLIKSSSASNNNNNILYSQDTLQRNFYAMAISFSVNHGCVTACLAYASTLLGNNLGSAGSGTLYVFYAITAFLLSKPIVSMVGPKNGLLYGVIGYSIYITGFMFAVIFHDIISAFSWIIMCSSAAIGGVAGGLLWTAQGRYFTEHCKLYSESTGRKTETITSDFAGSFAFIFLFIELFTKIIATFLYLIAPTSGSVVIFMTYSLLSIGTCFVMSGIDDLNDPGNWDFTYSHISTDAGAAAKLLYLDGKLPLLMPFQLTFGFASSFVPYYVFGTVIAESDNLGREWIGALSALVLFSGAVASLPAAQAANILGKSIVISIGGVALVMSSFVFFLFSNAELGTWFAILPLLILYGIGRGIWENTNKAVIADFYSDQIEKSTSAFAATSFFTGYASAMGYFAFPYIPRLGMAGLVVVSGIISLFCYRFAFSLYSIQKQSQTTDKMAIVRSHYLAHIEREKHNQSASDSYHANYNPSNRLISKNSSGHQLDISYNDSANI